MPNSYPTILCSPLSLIFKIILGLALLTGLVACGGSDDPETFTVTFTDATVVEGDTGTTELIFSATISPATTEAASIAYTTVDVTTTAGTDYVTASGTGTLDIPAGSASASIILEVNGDYEIEADETLTLNLSDATGVILTTASLTGTITNDDADQDASGLYSLGVGTLDGTDVDDIRAFVHAGRIIAFSVNAHLLLDGTIDSISGADYTATVNVYKDGALDQADVSVTGLVVTGSQISGTLGGTGTGAGDFSLTFDLAYNDGATIERIRDGRTENWEGDLLTTFSFADDSVTGFLDAVDVWDDEGNDAIVTGIRDLNQIVDEICDLLGDIAISNGSVNIYSVTQDLSSSFGSNSERCQSLPLDPVTLYTGFAAVLSETGIDIDLLYAVTNGDNAVFGFLHTTR